MPIELDLRRDLSKIQNLDLSKAGACTYSAPCAVGAMMTQEQRDYIRGQSLDSSRIETLIRTDIVSVPSEQREDFVLLQSYFDNSRHRPDLFERLIDDLNQKYSAAENPT